MFKIDQCVKDGHYVFKAKRQRECRDCERIRGHGRAKKYSYKEYHKTWSAARYQMMKEIIIRSKARPCMDCNVQYNHWIMEFDHKNPSEKLFTIGRVGRMQTPETLKAEISKCEVVCSNCHADRTHKSEYWKKAIAAQRKNRGNHA